MVFFDTVLETIDSYIRAEAERYARRGEKN